MMRRKRITLAALAAGLFAAPAAHAQPDAFAFGNPALGKTLYAQKCAACHVANFGGDGSSIFTRADRKIHTAAALRAGAVLQRAHAREAFGRG